MFLKTILKRVRQALALCGVCLLLVCTLALPASAAESPLALRPLMSTGVEDVDTLFTNLTDFITGVVKIVGSVLCIYGLFQVGMSFSSHDPSQRIQGLMCIAGAVIIFFSPEILTAIQK